LFANKVDVFVDRQRHEIARIIERSVTRSRATGSCDRARAEAAVAKLYAHLDLPAPKFIWFEGPFVASRAAILWDLMQAMLNTGPTGSLFTADAVRHPTAKKIPTIRQRIWQEAFPLEAMKKWSVDTQWRLSELTNGSAELTVYDTVVWIQLWQRFTMERYEPDETGQWLQTWRLMQEPVQQISQVFAENWDCFADLLFAMPDGDRRYVVDNMVTWNVHHMPDPDRDYFPAERFFDNQFGMIKAAGDSRALCHVEVLNLFARRSAPIIALIADCLEHCGWWRPEAEICFMVDRPTTLELDERGHLHRRAIYPDGDTFYAIHGIEVSERIAEGKYTASQIDSTANIEVRRVMIEDYGAERYLKESGAEIIHRDSFGVLYRKALEGDEPIVMVKVRNSTPEPDGTFKDYFLRVPPNIVTAHEAVAWSFGMERKHYAPTKET
jgi:hypothetical protein